MASPRESDGRARGTLLAEPSTFREAGYGRTAATPGATALACTPLPGA